MTKILPLALAAAALFAASNMAAADIHQVAQRGYTPISIRTPAPKAVIEKRRATGQGYGQQALQASVNWGPATPAAGQLRPTTFAYDPPTQSHPSVGPVDLINPKGIPASGRAGRGSPPSPTVFEMMRSLPTSEPVSSTLPLENPSTKPNRVSSSVGSSLPPNPLRPSGTYNANTLVSSLNGPAFIRVQAPDVTILGDDDFDPTSLSPTSPARVDDLLDPPPSAFAPADEPQQPQADLFDSAPIIASPAADSELVPIPPRPRKSADQTPPDAGLPTSAIPNFNDLPIGVDSAANDQNPAPSRFPGVGSVPVSPFALTAPPLNQDSSKQLVTDQTMTVAAGTNQIIEIARFHLNRFVTPIQNPVIRTTSSAQIDIQADVIYVAAVDDQPIALYITSEGNEALAIVVTLIPKSIPPREVRLQLRPEDVIAIGPSANQARPEAQQWEQRQPYVNTIIGLLKSAASGSVPPGYRLRRHSVKDPAVFCSDPFLQVEPVQIMEGHSLSLTVSAVKNISQGDVTINELQCTLPGVAAVSAYPTPFLRPGQSAELYVVNRKYVPTQAARTRPSVIDPDYLR